MVSKTLADQLEEYYRMSLKSLLESNYTGDEITELMRILSMGDFEHLIFFGASELHMFERPLEDMPLYINDNPQDTWHSQIAKWRLNVGK